MTALQNWVAAGQPSHGSGSPMVLVRDPSGVLHVALSFRDDLLDHPMLQQGMEPVAMFAEDPRVAGVAPLVLWDRPSATFVYPMDQGVLLSDIAHARRFHRAPHAPRAALDLLVHVGPVLDAAAALSGAVGLPSHGALDPWRIVVHPAGSVSLLGYGLPAVDVTTWLDEETDQLPGSALRFFPPERIEDSGEDVRSDVYAATLAAAELIFGGALLTGEPRHVVDAILAGEVVRRLEALGDGVPAAVIALLRSGLARDPEQRPASGTELARRAQAVLDSADHADGPSLFDLARPLADTGVDDPFRDFAEDEDTHTEIIEPRHNRPTPRRVAEPEDDKVADPPGPEPPTVPLVAAPLIEPHAEPDTVDSLAPILPDEHPPPLADPAQGADLAVIQAHGRKIAERTRDLAVRATALAARISAKSGGTSLEAGLVRRANQAAQRAARAADATTQSAHLLGQDVDVAASRITLDLVRNAEAQCEAAVEEAEGQLQALELHQHREAARVKATAEAAVRASEHAQVASDAANQADDLVTELEGAQAAGRLSAQGCAQAVDQASAFAEQAHRQADDARHHAEQAAGAARPEIALRHAEAAARAEEQALASFEDTQRAAERARRLEAQAHAGAVSDARLAATAAHLALGEARRALELAQEQARLVSDGAAHAALARCEAAAQASDVAATLTSHVAREVEEARGASGAAAKAELASAALTRTRQQVAGALAAAAEITTLAGAAGEGRALLSLQAEDAEALLGRAQLAAARAREELDGLLAQAGELVGEAVVKHRRAAQAASARAQAGLPELERLVRSVKVAISVETAQRRVPELRTTAQSVLRDSEVARDAIAQAWEAAEEEIVEARRQQTAERAIAAALQAANGHAAATRRLVDQAKESARQVQDTLRATLHDDARRLHQRALEVIDVATFQAGEAEAAAGQIVDGIDPSEARAQAQTALSFFERVSADLPEAMSALEQATLLTEGAIDTMSRAQEEAAAAQALVGHLAATAAQAVDAARIETEAWGTLPEVVDGLAMARASLEDFEQDRSEVEWAVAEAPHVADLGAADRVLNAVEAVVVRARDRRRELDTHLQRALDAAASAQADVETRAEARLAIAQSIDAVLTDLQRIQAAAAHLDTTVAEHRAGDHSVLHATDQMSAAIRAVQHAGSELSSLATSVASASTGAEARAIAQAALVQRKAAQAAVELAAEAEIGGLAAAEAESRAREAAEERALDHAREEAAAASGRIDQVIERVEASFQRARSEGLAQLEAQPFRAEGAESRYREASELSASILEKHVLVIQLVNKAARAETSEAAAALAKRAQAEAEEVAGLASRALEALETAVDLARTALVEGDAIRKIRKEIGDLASRVDSLLARTHHESKRVLDTLAEAGTIRPESADAAPARTIETEARIWVTRATEAAEEVRRARPLASRAHGLAEAQAILEGSRSAALGAIQSTDALADVLGRARDQLVVAQLLAAEAMEEARMASLEPAREAAAAAKKAEAWFEAGRREAREARLEDELTYELSALARASRAVDRHAGAAQRHAEHAAQSTEPELARAAAEPSAAAAQEALAAADDARQALERLRSRIAEVTAAAEVIAGIVQEAARLRVRACEAADQAEATLQSAQGRVAEVRDAPPTVARALDAIRSASETARLAAGRATTATQHTRGARGQSEAVSRAAQVRRARDEATSALATAQAAEKEVLAALEDHRQATTQRVRSLAEERRRKQAEALSVKRDEQERQREAALVRSRRRDEERRIRVDRRREERGQREPLPREPPVRHVSIGGRTRSDVRSLLDSGRYPSRANTRASLYSSDGRAAGRSWTPRTPAVEMTDSPTAHPAEPSESTRGAELPGRPRPDRTLAPGRGQPTPPPAPSPRGTDEDIDSSKVDALLERLRAKRNR